MHSANKNCIIAQESIYHFFHILARRKTSKPALSPIVFIYCNPRSREGSDQVLPCWCNWTDNRFQSTLPRGERRVRGRMLYGGDSFQSTLPRGERPPGWKTLPEYRLVSIHAPARGATGKRRISILSILFQSTLPRGERLPTCLAISA